MQVFTLLTILIWGTACNGQVKKDLPKETVGESNIPSVGHPKLIKNLGSLKDKGNNVHCSLQDKAGNLWFGTTGDGVYKYDGKSFTQFTTSNGMNSNTVWCILEDKSGKIWIGTDDGVCLYDDHKFSKIQIALPNDTLSSKYDVWSIMQDKRGKLWFATTIGVYVYDGKSFNFFKVTDDIKDCYAKIENILEDNAGNFWFGGRCHDGVYRYDGKSITYIKLEKLYEDSPRRERNWAFPQLQDKNGNIWFSNWDGVYRYDGKSFTTFTKKDGLSGNMVCRIIEDKKGNIWFGGAGLSRYDGKSFTRFTTKDGLLNESIWSILEDKTGAIWVGTRETILHRFDGKTFISYTEEGTQTESLMEDIWNPFGGTIKPETKDVITPNAPNNIVRTIIQDRKGNIWMASWEGIIRYDGKSFTNMTSKVTSARFFSVLEDRKGNFWFGTIGSGAYYYDGNSFQNFTTKEGLLNDEVTKIYEDKKGDIWFGVSGGISHYDGKSFGNYIIDGNAINEDRTEGTFSNRQLNSVNTIIEDKTGKLWIGTRGDAYTYDGKTFTTLRNNEGKAFKNVWGIIEDSKGNIWFGEDGLWRYDGSTFTKVSKKGALSIIEDKKGNVWTSSGVGRSFELLRYDGKSLSNEKPRVTIMKSLGDSDAFFGILEAFDGSIWVGSGNGVYRYDGNTFTDFKSAASQK